MRKELRPAEITKTIGLLRQRITERFPDSGLGRVAGDLHEVSTEFAARAERIRRPSYLLEAATVALILLALTGVFFVVRQFHLNFGPPDGWSALQAFEAVVSTAVFLGAAVLFLLSLGKRRKRRLSLDALHELRVLAHVIDMHQLTKDPERLRRSELFTESSPKPDMTPFLLGRYLHYCSEMLSLIGKVAALYLQAFQDDVVLDAVDDIEDLTTGLCRKIWQKLMILEGFAGTGGAGATAGA